MTLRETLERVRSMTLPANEEAAKLKIIMPILRDLGWDEMGDDVMPEYSVGQKSSKNAGRVDIALAPGGKQPIAMIEAKGPRESLDDHLEQLMFYAFNQAAQIVVLTNGVHWWLYLPQETSVPTEDRKFADLNLREGSPDEIAGDLETFLGREALVSRSAATRAKQVLTALREADRLNEHLPRLWREMLGQAGGTRPDAELVDLVSQRAYDKLNLRPASEQIIDVILGKPVSQAPADTAKPTAKSERDVRAARSAGETTKRKVKRRSIKPTGFVLWGHRRSVEHFSEIVTGVAEAIHDRHPRDFHRIGQLRGKKWPYASQRPQDLYTAKQVGMTGWHVDVHMGGPDTIRRAKQFLAHFGHDPKDLEVLYDSGAPAPPEPPPPPKGAARRPQQSKPAEPNTRRRRGRPSAKPTGFELWGQRHDVRRLHEITVGVAEAIAGRHPHDFKRIGELQSNRGNPFASKSPDGFHRSRKVRTTDWYVDVNLSAVHTEQRARRFLEHFGYDPDDLKLHYD